jgi:tight adherence protein C
MTTWLVTASALALFTGATLLLSRLRWFSRPSLPERLRPHLPSGMVRAGGAGVLSVESFGEVVGPASRALGERLSRLLGVGEDVELRLDRVHAPMDVTAFRVRQFGWVVVGFAVGALLALTLRLPLGFALLFASGGPLLAFLVVEQQLAVASQRWQRRVFLELPIVAEQLAMLLAAGFSLTSALTRIAERGHGAVARDLARVLGRIRQGVGEVEALREWALLARVPALDRLVPVLALNRDASDLGRLISEEARGIRRDVQRELIAHVERRGEQVWIPVTVATLVPGVLFMVVPFVDALRVFGS